MANWPWPEEYDAVHAAPDSHSVVLENKNVRVLEIQVEPGTKEPFHTHKYPSVLVITNKARLRYYGADMSFSHETGRGQPGTSYTEWHGPEDLHAVENIDTFTYHAFRIELKQTP